MYKIKAMKKEMSRNYYVISIGYCKAEALLHYEDPVAYSAGSLGWACDYYCINGVVISTGYAPIGSRNTKADYQMIEEYNNKASQIVYNGTNGLEEKQKAVAELLHRFVETAVAKAREEAKENK